MSAADPVPTVVSGHTFTIDTRYVLAEARILGKGSFGVVTTAYDSIRKIDLAIKRIRPYANDEWDAKHTLREIRLLKLLGPHPNIISIYELSLFVPKTELYMMMELMDCDLHRVIQSKQALSEKHHKCFLKQMLEGIKAMHAIGVFHRDLKPGNILVSKDCQLRITDFGLARFMDESTRTGDNELNPMTEYVVTRWYRPPELLLAPNLPYGEAVDLWSIGCIFAEMVKRKPLFPGKDHLHQVKLIFEVFGYIGKDQLGFEIDAESLRIIDQYRKYNKQPLQMFLPNATMDALALIEALLTVNPKKRPSAEQALQTVYLQDAETLHDYSKEYLTKPSADFFEFEHKDFDLPALQKMVQGEVDDCNASNYARSPKLDMQAAAASDKIATGISPRAEAQGQKKEYFSKDSIYGVPSVTNTIAGTPADASESNLAASELPTVTRQINPATATTTAAAGRSTGSSASASAGTAAGGNDKSMGPTAPNSNTTSSNDIVQDSSTSTSNHDKSATTATAAAARKHHHDKGKSNPFASKTAGASAASTASSSDSSIPQPKASGDNASKPQEEEEAPSASHTIYEKDAEEPATKEEKGAPGLQTQPNNDGIMQCCIIQ